MDSDDQFTGSASEFLAMAHGDEYQPEPVSDESPEEPLAAADDFADEGDEDLTPEERVAAVLAQDQDEDAEDTELVAESDDADAEPEDDDLDGLSPEHRELIEEARRLRQEKADAEIYAAENTIVANADAVIGSIEATRDRDIAQAKAHYSAELNRLLAQVDDDAENAPDPRAYRNKHRAEALRNTQNSQDAWIANIQQKAAADQAALVEQTNVALYTARVERLKPQYAEWLCQEKGLPLALKDKILEIGDVERMPWWADQLVAQRNVARTQKRRANQQVREEAAKRVTANAVHSPATGRARSAKVVELQGTPEEFLALRRA